MKKTYIIPHVSISEVQQELPLAASDGSGVNSNNDITYGGVDEQGEMEPSVKESFFDFQWE